MLIGMLMCQMRSGYPDFMLKEIHEQPRVRDTPFAGRLGPTVLSFH